MMLEWFAVCCFPVWKIISGNPQIKGFPLVTPAGFKPTTSGTGILRSIQLNYEANECAANLRKKLEMNKRNDRKTR